MKKLTKKGAVLSAIAACVLFASCTPDANSNYYTDVVQHLDSPNLTVKAYPGVNVVSWEPVTGSNGYVVYKYENGVAKVAANISYNAQLIYEDTDILNDNEYKYFVEATSKSSSSRAVVTENSKSNTATVKGIVPSYDVKSLDLYSYENYGTKENPRGKKDFVVSASNINITKDGNNYLSISFPGKAYLDYTVATIVDNQNTAVGTTLNSVDVKDRAANDVTYYVPNNNSVKVVNPGTYKVLITAASANGHFGKSASITSDASVKIETLEGSGATISDAKYTDLGKTVRVEFGKYTLKDGTNAPLSYYKVYRSVYGTLNYENVSGSVKAEEVDSVVTKYYVDDAITDNTKKYTYTVVVTDGTKFAPSSTKDVNAYALAAQTSSVTVSGAVSVVDTDAIKNDITWTINLPSSDVKIAGVYELSKPVTDTNTPVAADFARTTNISVTSGTNTDGKVFTAYTKDHTYNTNVYLLVVTTEENKQTVETVSTAVKVVADTMTQPKVSAKAYDNTLTTATPTSTKVVKNDVIVNVDDTINTKTDSVSNYTYKLYKTSAKVSGTVSTITWDFTTADWKEVQTLELKQNGLTSTATTTSTDSKVFTAVYTESDLDDAVYAYKVVKTNNITKQEKINIGYVQVSAKATTISYQPVITAQWNAVDLTQKTKENVKVTFKKDMTNLTAVNGTGDLASYVINYTGAEEAEEGATYTLYKRVKTAGLTNIVWEKVDQPVASVTNNVDKDIYYLDNNKNVTKKSGSYADSITYTWELKDVSTAYSYEYIVEVTKTNADTNYYTNIVTTVQGANYSAN